MKFNVVPIFAIIAAVRANPVPQTETEPRCLVITLLCLKGGPSMTLNSSPMPFGLHAARHALQPAPTLIQEPAPRSALWDANASMASF
jgi:hypothetical protein